MASLSRSWIKIGYYPLAPILAFKWTNTQQYHDQQVALQRTVQHAKQQVSTINHDVTNDQPTFKQPLYQWSDADFASFKLGKIMTGKDDADVRQWLKQLILRDKLNGLLQRIEASKAATKGGEHTKQWIAQLNDASIYAPGGYRGTNGWSQLRFISKAQFESAKATKHSVNLDAVVSSIFQNKQVTDNGRGSWEPRKDHNHDK